MKKTFKYAIGSLCTVFAMTAYACSDSNTTISSGEVSSEVSGDVLMYLTTSNRAFDLTKKATNFSTKDNMSPTCVTLAPTTRYQTIDGFGAAITGSTSYNLLLMPADKRRTFLEETFSPDKYGFSYVRISIGCSDFSLSDYTCCDTKV